ncbi:MAG: flippase-like domain-containing protein [Lachnospiraceae bacterium]|nr:flippase-like domain-containing protein [Lachnospiraceae bacterium]
MVQSKKTYKKILLEGLFLIGILALTLYSVFHEENPVEIWGYLEQAQIGYLLFAVFLVIIFILCESVIIWYLMHTVGQKVVFIHCCLYSFVGFFFSAITPSASGGQPAQLYFMKKDKLPLAISTLILMVVTITYKAVLIVLGVAVLIFRPSAVMYYLQPVMAWCYLGIILNVICVWGMLALVFRPELMYRLAQGVIDVPVRLFHWRSGKKYLERLDRAMGKYSQAAVYFRNHKRVVLNVFVITCFQRACLFLVTAVACRSLGITEGSIGMLVILQGMISVAVDMLPLPGGMGITEVLFLCIFTPLCGENLTLPVLILSRGISYYTQVGICGIMTAYAYISASVKGGYKA